MFGGVTDRIIFHYKHNTSKAEEKETFLYTHLVTCTLCINIRQAYNLNITLLFPYRH